MNKFTHDDFIQASQICKDMVISNPETLTPSDMFRNQSMNRFAHTFATEIKETFSDELKGKSTHEKNLLCCNILARNMVSYFTGNRHSIKCLGTQRKHFPDLKLFEVLVSRTLDAIEAHYEEEASENGSPIAPIQVGILFNTLISILGKSLILEGRAMCVDLDGFIDSDLETVDEDNAFAFFFFDEHTFLTCLVKTVYRVIYDKQTEFYSEVKKIHYITAKDNSTLEKLEYLQVFLSIFSGLASITEYGLDTQKEMQMLSLYAEFNSMEIAYKVWHSTQGFTSHPKLDGQEYYARYMASSFNKIIYENINSLTSLLSNKTDKHYYHFDSKKIIKKTLLSCLVLEKISGKGAMMFTNKVLNTVISKEYANFASKFHTALDEEQNSFINIFMNVPQIRMYLVNLLDEDYRYFVKLMGKEQLSIQEFDIENTIFDNHQLSIENRCKKLNQLINLSNFVISPREIHIILGQKRTIHIMEFLPEDFKVVDDENLDIDNEKEIETDVAEPLSRDNSDENEDKAEQFLKELHQSRKKEDKETDKESSTSSASVCVLNPDISVPRKKDVSLEFVKKLMKPLPLHIPDEYTVRKVISDLYEQFPYATSAIDALSRSYLQTVKYGKYQRMKPVILVGEPGCGKTTLALKFFEKIGIPFHKENVAGVWDSLFLLGNHKAYAESSPSNVLQQISKTGCPNMAFIIDEIDKVSKGSDKGDFQLSLLSYLDKQESKVVVDKFLDEPADCSNLSWVMTANILEDIPAPIRSRCTVVRVQAPTVMNIQAITQTIAREIEEDRGLDEGTYQFDATDYKLLTKFFVSDLRKFRRYVEQTIDFNENYQEEKVYH